LLKAYLLEKCLFEIEHEMLYRPDWLRIPIRGILDLIGEPQPAMTPAENVQAAPEIQAQRLS
jgi:predicted trehalose synthase